MKKFDDSNIIFAFINPSDIKVGDDDDEEDDDEDWTPPKVVKKKPETKKRSITDITVKNPRPVKTLNDLISVLEETAISKTSTRRKVSIDDAVVEREYLLKLIDSLVELRDLIGMKKVKDELVNQILLFMQKMNDPGMFLHTVLTGNPGCGKTTLCHILAKIYKHMGFLSSDKVVIADRSQLIGKWLGETSIKTKNILESAKGGVLLIDEAYSLGSSSSEDSYSKECIDCINQYLSENAEDFICIIAGYKDDLDKCFFSKNQGLERRFPWRYHIEQYNPEELYNIFDLQVSKDKWKLKIKKDEMVQLLTKNKDSFKNNGGDTKNLLDKCKICHAQRVFGSRKTKKTLTIEDIKDGLEIFTKSRPKTSTPPTGMYC
jgi:SpoVK/Ycf46/Vps4 family AAA+-type ATPase